MAANLVILGILLYFVAWFAHDKGGVPKPGEGPRWRTPPAWLRRLLRRGQGPILLISALFEITGIVMIVRGLAAVDGRTADTVDAATGLAMTAGILLIGGVWIGLYAVSRLR